MLPPMIGARVAHYRIDDKLGEGGMGVVYRAEDETLKRPVALKFLAGDLARDQTSVERFYREARVASGLNHPHICTIYEVGEHQGQHYIAMELLEGNTLRQELGGRPLPVERLVELGTRPHLQPRQPTRAAAAARTTGWRWRRPGPSD